MIISWINFWCLNCLFSAQSPLPLKMTNFDQEKNFLLQNSTKFSKIQQKYPQSRPSLQNLLILLFSSGFRSITILLIFLSTLFCSSTRTILYYLVAWFYCYCCCCFLYSRSYYLLLLLFLLLLFNNIMWIIFLFLWGAEDCIFWRLLLMCIFSYLDEFYSTSRTFDISVYFWWNN